MWLRARRSVGWGAPAEEALAIARSYFRAAAMTPVAAVFLVGFFALRIWHESPQAIWDPTTLQLLAKNAALCLGLSVWLPTAPTAAQSACRTDAGNATH